MNKYKYYQENPKQRDVQNVIVPRDNHHYNRPRCTIGELSLGESKVSVGGYIDSLDLIGQLLDAGENLQALRIAMSGMAYDYDVYDESIADNDIMLPKSRHKGFDLVEWSNLKRDLDGKVLLHQQYLENQKESEDNTVSSPQEPKETVKVTSPAGEPQAT